MQITIDGVVHDFHEKDMTNFEGMDIEKVTGMTFGEWEEMMQKGSLLAITALVWVMRKREEKTLRFSDVKFTLGAFDIRRDDEEEDDDGAGKAEPAPEAEAEAEPAPG